MSSGLGAPIPCINDEHAPKQYRLDSTLTVLNLYNILYLQELILLAR